MQTGDQDLTLILEDGRRLGFAEYGVPSGRPVFHFHGSGGSRLEHPSPEDILTRLNIRFISVDRPGNGSSDFQAGRRILDWAEDIRQLADHLEIEQFYVEGHSAGGPHALACAHQLPGRVVAGAVISSVAPMNRPNAYAGMPALNQLLARSARYLPLFTRMIRWSMRKMIMGDLEKTSRQLMASIPDSDRAVLYDSQNVIRFRSAIREGFRSGSRGVAQDDTLVNRDWGFDLKGVTPRIDIWHGEADVNVPIGSSMYLRDMLPHQRTVFLPGEGHFFILKYWDRILAALVQDGKVGV
jgi:pimeloyl-ACP methyl ester carboxylesterase